MIRSYLIRGVALCVAIAILLFCGYLIRGWWRHRPHPPKPWDRSAITATFERLVEYLNADGLHSHYAFVYVVRNNTSFDYDIGVQRSATETTNTTGTETPGNGQLTGMPLRVENKNGVLSEEASYITLDSVDVPAGRSVLATVRCYTAAVPRRDGESDDAWRQRVVEVLSPFDGDVAMFVYFDRQERYEISFPVRSAPSHKPAL